VTPAALPTLTHTAAIAVLLLGATACTHDSTPSGTTPERTTASPASTTTSGRTTVNTIRLIIDGTPVDVPLNDSLTARDLAEQLPLRLTLTDFHRTEKIAYPPRRPSTSGAPEGADPRAGDLA
jgi:hypothetical protein